MYKKFTFLISLLLLAGLAAGPALAAPDPVGCWNFDDGTANDSSGNDHHGTLDQGDGSTSVSIVYDADRDSNVLDCDNPEGHTNNSVVDCGTGSWANIQSQITVAA